MATSTTIQNRLGMPRKSLVAKAVKSSFSIEIVAPLVIRRPMPRSAVSVASVMMKGGSPICVMPKPWNMPMPSPTISVMTDRQPAPGRRH